MAPDPVDVGTQMDALAQRLRALEARVRVLEERAPGSASLAPGEPAIGPAPPSEEESPLVPAGLLPLTGRALVVLGGGFLLRALTDDHALPAMVGVAAGLAYAAFWLQRADADARRQEGRLSAVFHGLTALGMAYPLLLETTLRFHLIGPSLAGLLVVACFAAGLAVTERRRLRWVAWANAIAASASGLALQIGTHDLLPLAASLLAIGALIESRERRATGPRAIVALATDLAVLLCAGIASRAGGVPEGYAPLPLAGVVAVALLLPTLYVGSAALRTLREAEKLRAFEVLQTPLALVLGFGGAARVLIGHHAATWPLGVAASVLALGCYLAAFAVVDRRANQATTFYAYTTLALLLAFGGLTTGLSRERDALALGALGMLVLMLAEIYARQTLRFHGVAYVVASAAASGSLRAAWDGLAGDAHATWRPINGIALFGAAMLALGYALLARRREPRPTSLVAVLPQMLAAAALLSCVTGFAALLLAGAVASAPGPEADAARTAAARTVVIAASAIGIAWAGGRLGRRDLVPLAYAALAAGALSLVIDNLPAGRPATLFVALAAYGGALLGTPRLLAARATT